MQCPNCGNKTEVLQTFAHADHVVRVRGHRDNSKCWIRSETVEYFRGKVRDLEAAKEKVLELSGIITDLKDFDFNMKRSLGMTTIYHLLNEERERAPREVKIDVLSSSE